MKYLITIYNRLTGTTSNLERTEETVDKCIMKELGGWDNLRSTTTIGSSEHGSNEYMQAGTTRNNEKVFSILRINSNIEGTDTTI